MQQEERRWPLCLHSRVMVVLKYIGCSARFVCPAKSTLVHPKIIASGTVAKTVWVNYIAPAKKENVPTRNPVRE